MEEGEGPARPWEQAAPAAAEQEDSDVNPRNLADLFGPPADQGRRREGNQEVLRAQVAGAGLDDEFELRKLQVFVRIRPSVTKGAPRWDSENCIHATSKCSIAIAPPEASQAYKNGDRGQTYSFTRVFDEVTTQQDYFESTAAPLVKDLLRNPQHNSVMMAYGITAAGKTYTIEGTAAQPGVMPRALETLFEGLACHVEPISARVAYYEVYNEQIYDLLEDAPLGPGQQRVALKLKEDNQGRVFVGGLTEVEVTSAAEALKVLRRGSKQRQRAETGLNYSSSRSHSIFTVMLYQPNSGGEGSGEQPEEAEEREERLGRLSFVDLAGSERAQRTGNVGVRLKESVAINSSLMTLGRCLEALRWNQQHKNANLKVVPYRESKVTHLFRDALHGWGQVILSVNVSPCAKDYDETSHVLKYAALATQIGTIQQAEAPRRVIKAISPAIKKVKRKAALPPEARGAKIKRAKKSPAKLVAAAEEGQPPSPGPGEDVAANDVANDSPSSRGEQLLEAQLGSQAKEDGLEEEYAAEDGLGEEGDVEFDGTPATPLEEEDGGECVVAELQAQVQALVAQLQQAEERCVLVEREVREEVAQEMEQLMREMDANYKERLAAEVAQLECRMATTQQAGVGALRRGNARGGGKASELADDADSAPPAAIAQWEAQLAAASQQAAGLQEQVDAMAQELGAARQHSEELQAALEEAKQQTAAQAEQVKQLQQQVAAAHQLAATTEQQRLEQVLLASNLRAELEQTASQKAALQAELEAERQQVAALVAEAQDARLQAQQAQREAARRMESTLQEEMTQLEANRAMEVEMLEEQLHRAKKDNAALKQRLEAAMATLATMASPSVSLMQRMAQACPTGNGRGAGGTPHDVALARARQAAAAEEMEQAAAAVGGSATTAGPALRGKASGRSRFGGGLGSGRQLPVVSESAELQEQPEAAVVAEPQEQPTVPEPTPVGETQQEGAEGGAGSTAAPAVAAAEPLRARRATRASAAHVGPQLRSEVTPAAEPAVLAAAKPGKRGRRATHAVVAALAAISEAAEEAQPDHARAEQACAGGDGASQPAAMAAEPAGASSPPQQPQEQGAQPEPEVAGEEAAAAPPQEPQHKGGRRGRRRTTAATVACEPEPAVKPTAGRSEQGEGQQQPVGVGNPETAADEQPAAAPAPARGRKGRRTTVSTLGSVDEEAPVLMGGGGVAAGQAADAQPQQGSGQPAAGGRRASSARRASRLPSQSDKENGGGASAPAVLRGASKAVHFAAIAEEREEEEAQAAAADAGTAAAAEPAAAAHPAAAAKRKRKLLPAKAESLELRSALGECNDEVALGAPAGGARRPRRQTQFFRL